MDTKLVTTAYFYEGKIEEYTRSYLPGEESAIEQAKAFFAEFGATPDSNTEVHHTETEPTVARMRECYEADMLVAGVARVCALEAVSQGALTGGPHHGTAEVMQGDLDFLADCLDRAPTRAEEREHAAVYAGLLRRWASDLASES